MATSTNPDYTGFRIMHIPTGRELERHTDPQLAEERALKLGERNYRVTPITREGVHFFLTYRNRKGGITREVFSSFDFLNTFLSGLIAAGGYAAVGETTSGTTTDPVTHH